MARQKARDMVTNANPAPSPAPDTGALSVRFQSAEFRRVTQALARFAARRTSLPILEHVRIRALPDGTVILSATDLNLSITVSGSAWCGEAGDLCVPAKQLADIVKGAPGTEVTLDRSGPLGLRVASGDAEMTMLGRAGLDFPKLPDAKAEGLSFVSTSGPALADMLDRVAHSVCEDETRFHLNGVWIECDGTTTRMVTTDGHRLTRHTLPLQGPATSGVILPARAATEISKLLRAERGAAVSYAIKAPHLFVTCGAYTIAAKLIDAQFPPYEQVIPTEHKKIATVERKLLIAALKRAKPLCGKARGVKLAFASGKLVLTADSPGAGTGSETMLAHSEYLDGGGTVTTGINPGYLLDVLAEIGDRFVTLEMGDELDPILVRATDDACTYSVNESRFLSVIMPMRI